MLVFFSTCQYFNKTLNFL